MASMILALVIYVLVVMRLTRLVNADTILDPLRIRVAHRFGPGSGFVYFLSCPWCVGMWISLILAIPFVSYINAPWWSWLPIGLACSQLVGMFAPLYNDDELEYEPIEND